MLLDWGRSIKGSSVCVEAKGEAEQERVLSAAKTNNNNSKTQCSLPTQGSRG